MSLQIVLMKRKRNVIKTFYIFEILYYIYIVNRKELMIYHVFANGYNMEIYNRYAQILQRGSNYFASGTCTDMSSSVTQVPVLSVCN